MKNVSESPSTYFVLEVKSFRFGSPVFPVILHPFLDILVSWNMAFTSYGVILWCTYTIFKSCIIILSNVLVTKITEMALNVKVSKK